MPAPKIEQLDFSKMHDLIHTWFTPVCWQQYGGPWHHIELWWEYKRPRPWRRLARWTLCRMGRHWTGIGWNGPRMADHPGAEFTFCYRRCGYLVYNDDASS